MATTITDTRGIIALAAAAVAVLALAGCVALMRSVRRLRRAQVVVLGEQGKQDLVAQAAGMQVAFDALRAYVDEAAVRLDARGPAVSANVEGQVERAAERAGVACAACNRMACADADRVASGAGCDGGAMCAEAEALRAEPSTRLIRW